VPQPSPSPSPAVRLVVIHEDDIAAATEALLAVLRGVTSRVDREAPNHTDENEPG
jgi:hypothetical protein